jgi:hypothetical protein
MITSPIAAAKNPVWFRQSMIALQLVQLRRSNDSVLFDFSGDRGPELTFTPL